jgi:hypothetical protein
MTHYPAPELEAQLAHRRSAIDFADRWTPIRRGSWFRNRRRSR